MSEPMMNLSDAVRELGALPEPQSARQRVDEAFGVEARLFQHALDKVFAVLNEGGFLVSSPELERLRARVAELERAAEQIRFLHKDSPMGPCPVCVDADAMARGGDGTVPYPCPTARLAGAKDCNPPDRLTATFVPLQVLREDVYESPLHRDRRISHDLPETGGAR